MRAKIEDYLKRGLREIEGGEIPEIFIEFWSHYYGQQVNLELTDIDGQKWHVDRLLHLDGRDEITDRTVSWRGGDLEQLDYSVEYLESVMPNWEDHSHIFPFAGIDSSERSAYDLVTLDYTCSKQPKISIWVHEKSFGYEEPFLIEVSPTFEQFMDYWNTMKSERS